MQKFLIRSLFLILLLSAAESWALPRCPSSTSVLWTNCQGTLTDADGSKYAGEFKDDKKNGQGAYNHADGSKYIGEWKDGKANGKGTHSLADGSKYVGEYKNGKPYGQSTKVWSNGTTNDGTWIEGLFVFE